MPNRFCAPCAVSVTASALSAEPSPVNGFR